MPESTELVRRLLETPDIERVVPQLPADVLHRLIDRCGLEACGDIVALATPAQLERLLDLDLWRAPAPGADEALDAGRFGLWLEVLLQLGAEVAADRLTAMDVELVVDGLAAHVRVFDGASVASYVMLDGTEVAGWAPERGQVCEIAGFVLEGRPSSAWDAIAEVLVQLHDDRPAFFARVMRGCIALSSDAAEQDISHDLLDGRDQHAFELGVAREARRERLGYVTPADARAFLEGAIRLSLDAGQPARSSIATASLRATPPEPELVVEKAEATVGDRPSLADSEAVTEVVEILRDAGVLTPPRALLTAGDDGDGARLTFVRAFVESHLAAPAELAFLANALLAGGALQERPFTPQEAADAVSATCNLGLENWPGGWLECDLVAAFQVGWTLLHRDLCVHTAAALIQVLADVECSDRDVQWALQMLRRELIDCLGDGEPWRARQSLDAILMLDATSWAALTGFIDRCPVLPAVVAGEGRVRTIDPADFAFFSANRQIAVARTFVAALPSALVG